MDEVWIKKRHLHLKSANHQQLGQLLPFLPGFLAVSQQDANNWLIEYDVRTLQFGEIANALKPFIPATWMWRWRISLYQYQDENNRDALKHKDNACCNRPPRH
ncbi:hypothetical protein [Chitinibacter sp. S2-10]|uniref:hypothetical protein n=1 Tax=Chitinibacter sp. S2-10 TaxID=3373597 RepID=UPI0039774B30